MRSTAPSPESRPARKVRRLPGRAGAGHFALGGLRAHQPGPPIPISPLACRIEMLVYRQSAFGRHDFHILAVRRIRRDRFRSLLPSRAEGVSGPTARFLEPGLLRLWPARAVAAARCRRFRHLSFPDVGVAQPAGLASGRHRLQPRAARVLQIQAAVCRSARSRHRRRRPDRFPAEIAVADRHFVFRVSQYQPSGRPDQTEGPRRRR